MFSIIHGSGTQTKDQKRGRPGNKAKCEPCIVTVENLIGNLRVVTRMNMLSSLFQLVHSEANSRRIHIVEQCFGSGGQVSPVVCVHVSLSDP